MNNMKHKILMTLALLITAVTGAWAEEKMVTINSSTMSSGAVTATGFNIFDNYLYVNKNTATITTSEGVITKMVIKKGDIYVDAFTEANVGVAPGTITYGSDEITVTDINAESVTLSRKGDDNWSTSSVDVYYGAPAAYPFLITWDAATKTGTFVMPAFDVEIAPIYAPVAQWAKVENADQIPTAIEGIIAGEAKDIVKAGTVAKVGSTENAQGTLMYLVTTTKEQPTSTTGFSATVPTGATLTGSYAEDQTVYVWYYIKGIDAAEGVTPTAENTFNDSEICATPLTVKLKANQFTLTLDPAPVKNITVTAGTETKTPTTEGKTDIKMNSEVKLKANEGYKFRKVEVKKGAPDVKIESFSIHTSSNDVYSAGTFTCSIIDILPANATNQTFEWKINSGAPAGTTIKTVSDDTKTVTILAGAVSGSITIEATAKDGGGANKSKDIMVKE